MYKLSKMLPYLFVCELAFLIMILVGVDAGGLIFLLFTVIPIACFVASIIYGWFNEFCPMQLLFPLFVGILFTFTFYIVSQEIVWVYIATYTAISLVGNVIGYLAKKFIKRTK